MMEKQASKAEKKKVIVVGAGIGGVATAARLAHAGFDVEVYEKNEFSGGRCSLIHHDGYRFDQGPSLLLLPTLFHQIYSDLSTSLPDHLDLIKCDPNYVIHYHDGESVELSTDRVKLRKEVERFEGPEGGAGLEAFLTEGETHTTLAFAHVLTKPFPHFFSLLRPSFLMNGLALHPLESIWSRTCRYFKTERMRRAFTFGSMYLGMSPFEAPGTYSLLQWTETVEGIWYPRGGFHQVVQTLQNIAESHGAKFHFSSPISHILTDPSNGAATGIVLDTPEKKEIQSDLVVVNADLAYAHNNLFLETPGGKKLKEPSLAKSLRAKKHSCSSISFYWAMDRVMESLNAHNIFLAEEYEASFDDIFKKSDMPREPSFYVNVPSRIDPAAAPEGKDAMVVLVPIGSMLVEERRTEEDWTELVNKARNQVIEIMEARLKITGIKDMIVWEEVNTPVSWRDKFNLTHGSILGISHDFFNVLSFRHQAKHPSVKNAYFVGASAHPGTGVPIALAGSKICLQTVCDDLGVPLPPSYAKVPPKPTSWLDVKQGPRAWDIIEDWAKFFFLVLFGIILGISLVYSRVL